MILQKQDQRTKEVDGGKGEGGRRRRTASEADEDMTLKRFKGAGEGEADGQNGSSTSKDCESMVMRGGEAPSGQVVEGEDGVGGVAGRGSSNTSPEVISLASQQDHSSGRSVSFLKENGSASQSQDKTGPLASAMLSTSTPTPPPLKPAPSAFSNTFPSLGQMPNLVPGAPAPKSSPTTSAAEWEDGVLSGYPKTAALISPGPVTISSPSQDNAPSVVLSASSDLSQKVPVWGSPPDASQVSPFNILVLKMWLVFKVILNCRDCLCFRHPRQPRLLQDSVLHSLSSPVGQYSAMSLHRQMGLPRRTSPLDFILPIQRNLSRRDLIYRRTYSSSACLRRKLQARTSLRARRRTITTSQPCQSA